MIRTKTVVAAKGKSMALGFGVAAVLLATLLAALVFAARPAHAAVF